MGDFESGLPCDASMGHSDRESAPTPVRRLKIIPNAFGERAVLKPLRRCSYLPSANLIAASFQREALR